MFRDVKQCKCMFPQSAGWRAKGKAAQERISSILASPYNSFQQALVFPSYRCPVPAVPTTPSSHSSLLGHSYCRLNVHPGLFLESLAVILSIKTLLQVVFQLKGGTLGWGTTHPKIHALKGML